MGEEFEIAPDRLDLVGVLADDAGGKVIGEAAAWTEPPVPIV